MEARFYALSTSLQECIPLMNLMKEFITEGFFDAIIILTVHCIVFEDNVRALEIVKNPKYSPRTKHIVMKHDYFWLHVEHGNVIILHISTVDQ